MFTSISSTRRKFPFSTHQSEKLSKLDILVPIKSISYMHYVPIIVILKFGLSTNGWDKNNQYLCNLESAFEQYNLICLTVIISVSPYNAFSYEFNDFYFLVLHDEQLKPAEVIFYHSIQTEYYQFISSYSTMYCWSFLYQQIYHKLNIPS